MLKWCPFVWMEIEIPVQIDTILQDGNEDSEDEIDSSAADTDENSDNDEDFNDL